MTQSHQAKCACHSHREEHHRHHGHHKKPQAPKGPPDDKVKDKPGEKLVVVKKPDEKPWSQWIAGDDARWFYRGRLKQGGGWEYQFMDGYTYSPRKDGPVVPIPGNAVLPKPALIVPPTSSSSTLTDYSVEVGYAAARGEGAAPAAAPAAEKESSRPFKPFEEKAKGKAAETQHKTKRADKVPEKKHKKKPSHPKKIATVVNADRGKKFNPNKIVRGWLVDYELDPEPES